jgi:PRTRC genetic system protein C
MTVKIEKLERVFLFNGSKLPDVNPEFSVEQVRDVYVNTYPELATAAVEGPTPMNGIFSHGSSPSIPDPVTGPHPHLFQDWES